MRIDFRRWGIFNLVGIGGFALQIGTIALLTRGFGWRAFTATAVSLELAALHNFIGHNRFTWNDRPACSPREWGRRYVRFELAKTTSLAISFALTMIVLATTRLAPEAANTIAVLVCALPNYLLSERLVFTRT